MTVTDPSADPVPAPFSRQLRRSTAAAHERAHHSAYMDALLGGRLELADYATLVAQYWFVYSAIEQGGDALADDPVAAPFVVDALRRVPGLATDLEHLLGPGWRTRIAPLPATEVYVARLHEVAGSWPGGWVAHHYTRYLGDLAGGQVVRGLLRRTYGVTGPGALFYDFDDVGSVPAFRTRYRALLDDAPWDETERRRVTDEVLRAFELNIALLDDLAGTVPAARLADPRPA